MRRLAIETALLLLAVSGSAAAQAIGTAEYYVKEGREALALRSYSIAATSFRQATMLRPDNAEYHFLLGTALASDRRPEDARAALERAVALDPSLKPRVEALLASSGAPAAVPAVREPAAAPPVARPAAPARRPATPPGARPTPAKPPAAGGAFAPGDSVEVEYRAGEWIPGVVTAADAGACAYYRVRADAYGNGNPSNLGYGCRSVRAPTGVAAVKAACGGGNANCPPTRPPPLGAYLCTEQVWQGTGSAPQFRPEQRGTLTLLSGNRYRMYRDGKVGRYRYDPSTFRVVFADGEMSGRGGVATYGLDGTTPEITIVFETAYTKRTGNEPPRWQCGLERR